MLTVFDSGIGGLSVLREIRKIYKGDVLYIGDTVRAPYGNRSKEEIILFTKQMLRFAQSHGATYFVSACNSISGNVTDALLLDLAIPRERFIDMGSVTKAHKEEIPRSILVVATSATLASGLYRDIFDTGFTYHEVALPLLAGAIENGDESVVQEALDPFRTKQEEVHAEAVFLGCTHYPLVLDSFRKCCYAERFIDPALFVKKEVETLFPRVDAPGAITVFLSKESAIFRDIYKSTIDPSLQVSFADFSLY